jgi:hypothetical protein
MTNEPKPTAIAYDAFDQQQLTERASKRASEQMKLVSNHFLS